MKIKLKWKCEKNHLFERDLDCMKRAKFFCPICKIKIKKTELLTLQ